MVLQLHLVHKAVCSTSTALNKFGEKMKKLGANEEKETKTKLNHGDAGNRTLYLSHAKRALYHMSYIPEEACRPAQLND